MLLSGTGHGGDVLEQTGEQRSGSWYGGTAAQRDRERDELRNQPTGTGLPAQGCRHLQVSCAMLVLFVYF